MEGKREAGCRSPTRLTVFFEKTRREEIGEGETTGKYTRRNERGLQLWRKQQTKRRPDASPSTASLGLERLGCD